MKDLDAYLGELTRRTSVVLGDSLVAIHLHGSAAMDAFVASRSDVDVLCITRDSLSPSQKRALAEALSEASLPCPGVGLEMSIVTLAAVRALSERPAFELPRDRRRPSRRRIGASRKSGSPRGIRDDARTGSRSRWAATSGADRPGRSSGSPSGDGR
jgi:hypothetical protein